MTFTHALSTNNYGPAKFIVDSKAADGTHTTIAAAISAASSGETIFIRPGTYTENLTLKAGVNLCAYTCNASLNGTFGVIIQGKCTFTGAGTVNISGIQLLTNSDFALAVTGSNASVVNLSNCFINCSNNSGISHTSNSSGSVINFYNCNGVLGTTGIAFFISTSAGAIALQYCNIQNTGLSTTASTISTGACVISYSNLVFPITSSSSAILQITNASIIPGAAGLNVTAVTHGGASSNCYIYHTTLSSGSSTAIVCTATLDVAQLKILSSSTTSWCSGAGTVTYSNISTQTTAPITATTQSGGAGRGIYNGQAPSAGFIGEQIRSYQSSGLALTSTVARDVTSISLTAGIWDVSGIIAFDAGPGGVATSVFGSISTTSATNGSDGDNAGYGALPLSGARGGGNSIPAYRLTLSSTTTVYLVASATFTGGGINGYGRISGTRVG